MIGDHFLEMNYVNMRIKYMYKFTGCMFVYNQI